MTLFYLIIFGLACGMAAYYLGMLWAAVTATDAIWVLLFLGNGPIFLMTWMTPVMFAVSFRAVWRAGRPDIRAAIIQIATATACFASLEFGGTLAEIVGPHLGLFV